MSIYDIENTYLRRAAMIVAVPICVPLYALACAWEGFVDQCRDVAVNWADCWAAR